jgi:hypothetical protein
MNESYRFPIVIPLTVLAFAAAHLTFEHFTRGVRSHNLLNRTDLPAISNWFGLITLPLLGVVLGLRVRAHPSSTRWARVPVSVLAPVLGALIYGVALAASFSLGATIITSAAFLGLFVCGIVFPVYRVEYILGFVTGMTVTFGGVLPLLVALVVAAVSFVVRYIVSKVAAVFRKKRGPS